MSDPDLTDARGVHLEERVDWGERLAFNNLLLHRGPWFYVCDLACAEAWNFSVPNGFPLKPKSPRVDYEGPAKVLRLMLLLIHWATDREEQLAKGGCLTGT